MKILGFAPLRLLLQALALIAWLHLGPDAAAQGLKLGEDLLDPKVYRSPSGTMSVFIDPSTRSGLGAGTYRLCRGDVQLWSKAFPFTLWDAAINDDGTVCGYAYLDGYPLSFCTGQPEVNILAVIIDPSGALRLGDPSLGGVGDADRSGVFRAVFARGVVSDPEHDLLTIQAVNGSWATEPVWRVYTLSTGAFLRQVRPEGSGTESLTGRWTTDISSSRVPGTPLMLVHRLTHAHDYERWSTEKPSATFTLIDPEGKSVWSTKFPDEYPPLGTPDFRISDLIREPPLQFVTRPNGFDVISFSQGVISYQIEADGSSWKVRETGRKPSDTPRPWDADATPSEVPEPKANSNLKPLGSFSLRGDSPDPLVRSIRAFKIDPMGRLGWIRDPGFGPPEFVLVDQSGALVTRVQVPRQAAGAGASIAVPLTANRWLFIEPVYSLSMKPAETNRSFAWTLDIDTGKLSPLDGLDPLDIRNASPTGDGGFMILTGFSVIGDDTMSRVVFFDASGRRTIQGPEAQQACLTTDGKLAIVSKEGDRLQFFTPQADWLRPERDIDISSLRGNPTIASAGFSALSPAPRGQVMLAPTDRAVGIQRISIDGTISRAAIPRGPDGKPLTAVDSYAVSPTGDAWCSDGWRLMRLNEDGVVDRVLGDPLEAPTRRTIAKACMDSRGVIYLACEKPDRVDVVDSKGRLIRQLLPPNAGVGYTTDLTTCPDGSVLWQLRRWSPAEAHGYFHFSASGEYLGLFEPRISDLFGKLRVLPDGSRLELGHTNAQIFAPDGSLKATISRQPDGSWLRSGLSCAVGADGTIAIRCDQNPMDWSPSFTVGVFDADGAPIRAISCSDLRLDQSAILIGSSLVDIDGSAVQVLDIRSGRALTAAIPGAEHANGGFIGFVPPRELTEGNRELWVLSQASQEVRRFAFPE